MPRPSWPGAPTSGSTITSRAATLRRATSARASVVTAMTGSCVATAWRSVVASTVALPRRWASLWSAPRNRLPLPAANTITAGCAFMRHPSFLFVVDGT